MQVARDPSIEGWLGGLDERLANLERLTIALEAQRGITEITWPGGSARSSTLVIPVTNGLYLRPFLTAYDNPGIATTYVPVVEALTETELKVFGFCLEGSPVASKSKLAWWLA